MRPQSSLATLVARGDAARNLASGRYAVGHKIAELTGDRHERLRALARPHLAIVQGRTGETANLSILAPPNAIYIDQVDGGRAVAALSVSAPIQRIRASDPATLGRLLSEQAQAISRSLRTQ
jgi:DNA-binding IclR family transcriptional regulator